MKTCPSCNNQNDDHLRYCQKCGASLSAGDRKCPACGMSNKIEADFCGGCGASLSGGAHASPTANSQAATVLVGQFESGQIIGHRYQVLRKLGQGGFGATYLDEHIS